MKRLITLISAISICLTSCLLSSIPTSAERGDGDVNGDGVIDSADARMILQYSIGNCELTTAQEKSADVSKNKIVNFKDVDYLWALRCNKKIKSSADSNVSVTNPSGTQSTTKMKRRPTHPQWWFDLQERLKTSTTTSTTIASEQNGSPTTTSSTHPFWWEKMQELRRKAQSTTTAKATTKKGGTTAVPSKTTKKAATTVATSTKKTIVPSGAKEQTIPSISAVLSPKYTPTLREPAVNESKFMSCLKIRNTKTGKVYYGDTKEKLQLAVTAVVKYELGNSRNAMRSTEAWKAQAVLAYTNVCETCVKGGTYTIGLSQDVNLKLSSDKRIYDAVGKVLGEKLMDSPSKVASVFYFSYASGSTATNSKYYVENKPYLQSVFSPETSSLVKKYYGSDSFVSTKTVSLNDLLQQLEKKIGHPISVESSSSHYSLYATEWDGCYVWKTNLYYTSGGNKIYVTGRQIRELLGLRSTSFVVTNQTDDTMTLSIRGNGHGVGMSQIGAVIYANEYNWNYKQILAHYFSITSESSCQIYKPKW